jgi:hypothetical protein
VPPEVNTSLATGSMGTGKHRRQAKAEMAHTFLALPPPSSPGEDLISLAAADSRRKPWSC